MFRIRSCLATWRHADVTSRGFAPFLIGGHYESETIRMPKIYRKRQLDSPTDSDVKVHWSEFDGVAAVNAEKSNYTSFEKSLSTVYK